jgi:hypothetical protein
LSHFGAVLPLITLLHSATSNETLSSGANISLALQKFFPSLTDIDIQEFLLLYPIDEFDSSSQHFQVVTGEPELICGVSLSLTPP